MSRHGYHDYLEPLALGQWRGRVASAIRGRRGQKLLRDMRDALDAMPEKRLIREHLVFNGEVCALGAVGLLRGINICDIDPEDSERIAVAFDIAEPLAREITYENDETRLNPESLWQHMREWVENHIIAEPA